MARETPRPPKPEGVEAKPRGRRPKGGLDGALEALRALADTTPTSAHLDKYRDEAFAQKNDRGAAILHATNLENAVETAIVRTLRIPRGKRAELFGFNAPMGSFAHKTIMAQALGIIGPKHRRNLDIVRAIRNAFAHAKVTLTFEDPEIHNLLKFLHWPLDVFISGKPFYASPTPPEGISRERRLFAMACTGMQLNLLGNYLAGPTLIDLNGLIPAVRDSIKQTVHEDAVVSARPPPWP